MGIVPARFLTTPRNPRGAMSDAFLRPRRRTAHECGGGADRLNKRSAALAPSPSGREACAEAHHRDGRSDGRARRRRAGPPDQTDSMPTPGGSPRRMKDAWIRSDVKIQLGETIVEGASVPDIGDKPENRNEDHQSVKQMVRRERNAAIKLANVERRIGRFVRHPPRKSGDDEGEINKPDAAMDVDPERAQLLWNVIEQETQGSEKNDQHRDDPVEDDSGRAIPRQRRSDAPPGSDNIHAVFPDFLAPRRPPQGGAILQSARGFFAAGWLSRSRISARSLFPGGTRRPQGQYCARFERSLCAAMLALTRTGEQL